MNKLECLNLNIFTNLTFNACIYSFKNIIFQFACGGFEERVVIPDDRYLTKSVKRFLRKYNYIFFKDPPGPSLL